MGDSTVANTAVNPDEPYGYLLVHFIEDPDGYAERIYMDISDGDNPRRWIPLNGGKPILTSSLGTTGVRDPHIIRNPETGVWTILATDLRVFGGDDGGFSHAGDIAAEDLGSGGLFVGGQLQKAPAFLVLIAQSLGADQLCAAHAGAQLTADLAKGQIRNTGHGCQVQFGVYFYVSDIHEGLLCAYCVSAGYCTTEISY